MHSADETAVLKVVHLVGLMAKQMAEKSADLMAGQMADEKAE